MLLLPSGCLPAVCARLPARRACLQGGTARTVLIICCSPCMDNAPETLSSLRFGSR